MNNCGRRLCLIEGRRGGVTPGHQGKMVRVGQKGNKGWEKGGMLGSIRGELGRSKRGTGNLRLCWKGGDLGGSPTWVVTTSVGADKKKM